MRDDGKPERRRDRCCRLEWSSGDMLKAGPPDVVGSLRGQECRKVRGGEGGGGRRRSSSSRGRGRSNRSRSSNSSSSPCLPAWLSLCLFCLTAPQHSAPL